MNPPLTNRLIEYEVRLSRKVKSTFRDKPERPPEPYYALLMAPYLDDKYVDKNKGVKR